MAGAAKTMVRAWDWPTRAFHWLLVAGILSAWLSHQFAAKLNDPTLIWHRWNGYFVLVLVVFRMLWGFFGSSTARFSTFVRGPVFVLRYLVDTLRGRKRHFLSHNPLGTGMILLLLVAVFTQATLGLFTLEHNEIVAGPLKRLLSDESTAFVSKLHIQGLNVIFILVSVHVCANAFYGMFTGEPLIQAMVTGEKPAADYEDAREAVIADNVTRRALFTFLAAIALVFGTVTALGGRIW